MKTYIVIIFLEYIFSLIFTREFIVVCARVGGANTTPFMAAHFAKRNTKFGGGGKRGRAKIPSPQPPSFLPARAFRFCARSAQSFGVLLKKSSNFRIADRTLVLDFKNAFKIAEKYHAEALCAEATSFNFAECKTWRRAWDALGTFFKINEDLCVLIRLGFTLVFNKYSIKIKG